MRTIHFSFKTMLTFNDYVRAHSFALRIIPPNTKTQKILSCSLDISPNVSTKQTVDGFGNNVTTGYIRGDHRFLDFEIKGTAEVDATRHSTGYMPLYRYQSIYTAPSGAIEAFHHGLGDKFKDSIPKRAAYICDTLSDAIEYKKGVTDTSTTASEAFALKAGVCQDFSHILISLLRLDGIPARYIAGLAFCDGETHSWVEYWTGKNWQGIDPANNCPVNDDYLMLARGRDFRDCAIDRGVMFGDYTQQLTLVRSVLS